MALDELRRRMDQADGALLAAFVRRMETAGEIAEYKRAHGLPVLDAGREREKLTQLTAQAGEALDGDVRALYTLLFQLSRNRQYRLLRPETVPGMAPGAVPPGAVTAYAGQDARAASARLLPAPSLREAADAEAVCAAVAEGRCAYGVIPGREDSGIWPVYRRLARHALTICRVLGPDAALLCVCRDGWPASPGTRTAIWLSLPDGKALSPALTLLLSLGLRPLQAECRRTGDGLQAALELDGALTPPRLAPLLGELERLGIACRLLGGYDEVE